MLKQTINEVLSGDTLKNALDFADFLEANEMVVDGGAIKYKGSDVCYMHLDGGEDYPSPWTIWTAGNYSSEYDGFRVSEGIKEIAWENINTCGNCGAGCSPGSSKMIFGKEFDNVCSADMDFYKPSGETLDCLKKLLEMRKYEIEK